MNFISAFIVFISLACTYGWKRPYPFKVFDRPADLNWDSASASANVEGRWIDQPFDHFDSNETRTFKLWYYQRTDLWKPNGPIYISICSYFEDCGQWIISKPALISILANETNGALFVVFPRYFGSILTSYFPPHESYYKFLNTTQSLADIASLIKSIKTDPQLQSSRVVVMGASEDGRLATWMRVVYPDLVDAVVAASAPLLAKKDAHEYLDTVRTAYEKYGSKDCIGKIETKIETAVNVFKNATALEILKKKHNICERDNFTVIEDQQRFIQYKLYGPYYINALAGHLEKIKKCEIYDDTDAKSQSRCWEWHLDYILKDLKTQSWVAPDEYQQCSEYGGYITTSSEKQPFVHWAPLEYFLRLCKGGFGIDEKTLDEGIEKTNRMFGGIKPNVTNVVFTQGELCPHRLLGVQQNLSDSAPAFVVNEYGCDNIMYTLPHEPKEAVEIRERVKSLVKKWIGIP